MKNDSAFVWHVRNAWAWCHLRAWDTWCWFLAFFGLMPISEHAIWMLAADNTIRFGEKAERRLGAVRNDIDVALIFLKAGRIEDARGVLETSLACSIDPD